MAYKSYADMVAIQAFRVYVGDLPAPETPIEIVHSVAEFFTRYFATCDYIPEGEDLVVQFCQMSPAGAFGSPATPAQTAGRYPGYTVAMEEAINAAWEIGAAKAQADDQAENDAFQV